MLFYTKNYKEATMLFLLNGQGVMQRLDNDRIFRGSNNFTKLGVIYPYDTVALAAIFTLPNGLATKAFPMSIPRVYTLTNAQTGQTKTFENLYYYETEITSDVTALEGVAKVTIAQMSQAGLDGEGEPVYSTVGTSYSASFTIEYAPYPDYTPVATPTTDDYNQLVQVLVTYQNMLNADLNALESTKQDKTDPALLTEDKTVVGAINELLDEVTGGASGGGLAARVAAVEEKTEMPLMTDFDVQGNTAQIDFNDGSQKEVRLPGGTSATQPWIRYSANANGNPMSATPSAEAAYVGFFVGLNPSTNPADYTWSRYKGIAISNVALDGFTFVITYENGDTQEVPIDTEDAIIVHEAGDSLVTSFNGKTGDVKGVSSFNGATGEVTGVSSFNGATGDIEFTTAEQAKKVLLPSGEYAAIQAAILDICYPVGSLKFSTSAANPSTYLGGTWVAWGGGRVPVGVDSSNELFNTVEKTGGSANAVVVSHSHTQQQHNHGFYRSDLYPAQYSDTLVYGSFGLPKNRNRTTQAVGGGGDWYEDQNWLTTHTERVAPTLNNAGVSGANANLQPSITCYIWKRLA